MNQNDGLINDFYEEAKDIIQNIYDGLQQFKVAQEGDKQTIIQSVFRGVHTIKGSCTMFGLTNLNHVAHDLETDLSKLKDTPEAITLEYIEYIYKIIDIMSRLLNEGDNIEISLPQNLIRSEQLPFSPPLTPPSEQGSAEIQEKIEKEEGNSEKPPFTMVINKLPEETIEKIKQTDLNLIKPAPPAEPQTPLPNDKGPEKEFKGSKKTGALDVIRVPVERVNQALDNIWEIFLIRNQLAYLIGQNQHWLNQHPEFIRSWEFLDSSLESNITELESKTMRMRMAPIKSIFTRLAQVVRNYSDETGKEIDFVTIGEETELDKKIIDGINEPLVHLIRNSCDHGLEPSTVRESIGKSKKGKIELSAKIVGNEVVIEVADDGRGIDAKKIVKKAEEKGIILQNKQMSEKEAIELIFRAGFSTAESVSHVSGRGIGMDIVQASVQKMGGNIDISTKVGVGTRFSMILPLSMSVVSALVMRVNSCIFASTTNPIIETKIVDKHDLTSNNNAIFYYHRNKYIRCFDLKNHIFKEEQNEDLFVEDRKGAICLIDYRDEHIALLVDRIEEYYGLVVKPLPQNAPPIDFVVGVSILATGEPIFIISLNKLCDNIIFNMRKVSEKAEEI